MEQSLSGEPRNPDELHDLRCAAAISGQVTDEAFAAVLETERRGDSRSCGRRGVS